MGKRGASWRGTLSRDYRDGGLAQPARSAVLARRGESLHGLARIFVSVAIQTSTRLYSDLAYLWPLVSPPAGDAADAKIVLQVLHRHLAPKPRTRLTLLELGCGGGHLLSHLTHRVDATAADLAPAMLALSRKLNPGVEHLAGDMRSLRLGKRFDAVLIHDALNYMLTERDLLRALKTAAAHLRPGGLVVLMPDDVRETFVNHASAADTHVVAEQGLEITSISHVHAAGPKNSRVELSMLFLIRDMRAKTLDVVNDRHTCGLFSSRTWLRLMRTAGLAVVEWNTALRGRPGPLFVGRRK
jgi:SAM-dependent methyltransferase